GRMREYIVLPSFDELGAELRACFGRVFLGAAIDAEAVFQRLPCPNNRSDRGRCVASRGGGPLRTQPEGSGALAQRWKKTGSVAAKPSGGSTSPFEGHAEFLLGLIVEQPDLTLDEIVAVMMRKNASQAAAARCGGSSSD